MSKKVKFLVRDVVSENDYLRLLDEKGRDEIGNKLKIGDKVGYVAVKSHSVSLGEIQDIWLQFGTKTNYYSYQIEANENVIHCQVKIKPISPRDRGCTRMPTQIVKVA
jgi:hypothetical protein